MAPTERLTTALGVFTVLCAAYFLALVVAIPERVGAPEGIWWTTAHSVFGVGTVSLATALHRAGPTRGRLSAGTALLVAGGILAVTAGIVPGFFADSRADPFVLANLVAVLFVFPVSFILVSLSMRRSDPWRPFLKPALLVAVAVPVSFVAVVLSPAGWEAALGRVTDLFLGIWVVLVAVGVWFVVGQR